MIKYICDACGKEYNIPALKPISIPTHITTNTPAVVVDVFGSNVSKEEIYELCGQCYETAISAAWKGITQIKR